jgi:ribonuclease HI
MELQVAIEGLKNLNEPCRVTLITDVHYLRQGINASLDQWIKWVYSPGDCEPIGNYDLWAHIWKLQARHQIHNPSTLERRHQTDLNHCYHLAARPRSRSNSLIEIGPFAKQVKS